MSFISNILSNFDSLQQSQDADRLQKLHNERDTLERTLQRFQGEQLAMSREFQAKLEERQDFISKLIAKLREHGEDMEDPYSSTRSRKNSSLESSTPEDLRRQLLETTSKLTNSEAQIKRLLQMQEELVLTSGKAKDMIQEMSKEQDVTMRSYVTLHKGYEDLKKSDLTLKGDIERLQIENARLIDQLEELKSNPTVSPGASAELSQEMETLRHSLDDVAAEKSRLESEWGASRQELESKLTDSEHRRAESLKQWEQEKALLESQLMGDAQKQKDALSSQMDSLRQDSLHREEELRGEIAALKAELQQHKASIAEGLRQADALEKSLESQRAEAESESARLKQEAAQRVSEAQSQLQSKTEEQQESDRKHLQALNTLRSEKLELESKLSQQSMELEKAIAAHRETLMQLEAQSKHDRDKDRKEHEAALSALESALAAEREKMMEVESRLNAKIAAQLSENENLARETDQLRQEHARTLSDTSKLSEERKRLQSSLQSKEQELDALRKSLEGRISVLESEVAKAAKEHEEALRALELSHAEALERQKAEGEKVRKSLEVSLTEKCNEMEKQYIEERHARRDIHNKLLELQGNIRVYCRCRPPIDVELRSSESAVVVDFPMEGKITKERGTTSFEYDGVFGPSSTQSLVFDEIQPFIVSALDGYNMCIFAYGQTGTGKTYTMEGPPEDPGVNLRSIRTLFELAAGRTDMVYKFSVSILEIYNENIIDLIESKTEVLEIRTGKNGNFVQGLNIVEVSSCNDLEVILKKANKNRTGSHNVNEHSSRSHLVLTIYIGGMNLVSKERTMSRLNLIDLAGSERISKTDAVGDQLREAQNINKSLSSLGDVINALVTKSKHIPYRNSKLTYLLQDCLSGDSKVVMLVTVSPVLWNAQETLCSLNFASRCHDVVLGTVSKQVDSAQMKKEIDRLTLELQQYRSKPSTPSSTPTTATPDPQ